MACKRRREAAVSAYLVLGGEQNRSHRHLQLDMPIHKEEEAMKCIVRAFNQTKGFCKYKNFVQDIAVFSLCAAGLSGYKPPRWSCTLGDYRAYVVRNFTRR